MAREGNSRMSVVIEITPSVVVIGQPWHVKVSGLKNNQDKLYIKNVRVGDDAVIPGYYYTADANGVFEIDPPPLAPLPDDPNPATLELRQAMGGGAPNTPPNSKLVASQVYQTVLA